jgi:hypothetical protein
MRPVDEKRPLLRHFLASLAYRTQKALRDAPEAFGGFSAGNLTRTPAELVRHMASLIGYARTLFHGGRYRPEPLPTLADEVRRFHENLEALGADLDAGTPLRDVTVEQLLRGPIADAMTHAGQLALLRRLAGAPIPPESFIHADMAPENLGPNQARPARPDAAWPERL